MSSTIIYPFTTDTNYAYDTNKIEVTGGEALLKEIEEGVDFSENFTTDTGFTYDNTKSEFTAGTLRQIDQQPTNAVFGAKFSTDENGNWGDGSLVGSLNNSAVISGGYLDCTPANNSSWSTSDNDNFPLTTQGTIKFKFTPNFTGAPSGVQYLFFHGIASGFPRIYCYVNVDTKISVRVTGDSDAPILTITTSALTWVSGQEYEISFDYDVVGGATNLFVDGVSKASSSATGTRSTLANDFFLGNYGLSSSNGVNGKFRDLVIFDSVQHTSNYTPGYSVAETKYLADTVTNPELAYVGPGSIKLFNTFTTTQVGSPRYTIQIGRSGDYLYWNGSSWAVSDNTYAQATDVSTFNANCGDLAIDTEVYGQFRIYFDDSNTLSSIDVLTANLNVDKYSTANDSLLTNSFFSASSLVQLTHMITETGSDTVKYIIHVAGQDKWSNAGTVENSNGTYAQANTLAEITAAISQFVTARSSVKIKVFLHSDDGSTTPSIDSLAIVYDAALPDVTLPSLIDVNGYVYDINGNPKVGEAVKARPYYEGYNNNIAGAGVFEIYEYVSIDVTDADGFFSGSVFKQPDTKYVEFKIGKQSYYTQLPDELSIDFSTLTLNLVVI